MTSVTIRRGDTLTALAKKYKTSVGQLAKSNKIKDPNKIIAGRKLNLPGARDSFEPGPTRWCAWMREGVTTCGPSEICPCPCPCPAPTPDPEEWYVGERLERGECGSGDAPRAWWGCRCALACGWACEWACGWACAAPAY